MSRWYDDEPHDNAGMCEHVADLAYELESSWSTWRSASRTTRTAMRLYVTSTNCSGTRSGRSSRRGLEEAPE